MALRIKFRVTERADLYYSPTAKRVTFSAVADGDIPVGDRVSEGGAPSITFSALCDTAAALEQFTIGSEFYFDVTAVPK